MRIFLQTKKNYLPKIDSFFYAFKKPKPTYKAVNIVLTVKKSSTIMINTAALKAFFQENSLTDLGLYLDFYPAIVKETSDGSVAPADYIRVICPDIYGQEMYEAWIPQRATFAGNGIGFYAVPNIGDRVNITLRNGRIENPFWEYGGWQKDALPATADGKPQSIILQSTLEQRLEFDSDGKVILHHTDDVSIEMIDDKVTIKNGTTIITMESDGIKIEAGGYSLKNLLDELLQAILNMKIATNLGPQPAINLPTFSVIKSTKIPQLLK